jgi:hypothetical protein
VESAQELSSDMPPEIPAAEAEEQGAATAEAEGGEEEEGEEEEEEEERKLAMVMTFMGLVGLRQTAPSTEQQQQRG